MKEAIKNPKSFEFRQCVSIISILKKKEVDKKDPTT